MVIDLANNLMQNEDGDVYVQVLTHVGQSAGGLPVQLALGQSAIRIAGGDVAGTTAHGVHWDRASAGQLETVDYLED